MIQVLTPFEYLLECQPRPDLDDPRARDDGAVMMVPHAVLVPDAPAPAFVDAGEEGKERGLGVAVEARRVAAKKRTVLAEQVMAAAEDACARIVRGQPAGARPARAVG